jgi:hypothetical protein
MNLTSADIEDIGKQTLKDQIEYNKKTEFHTRHASSPAFVRTEALNQTDFVFDFVSLQTGSGQHRFQSRAHG